MSAAEDFDLYFAECPLVAIIRGVTPDDAEATGGARSSKPASASSRCR